MDVKKEEKDENNERKIKLNKVEYTLSDALNLCQPGDILEGLSIYEFDKIILKLREKNETIHYFTDRRYGDWRLILTGERRKY